MNHLKNFATIISLLLVCKSPLLAQSGTRIDTRFSNLVVTERKLRTFSQMFPDATETIWIGQNYVSFKEGQKNYRVWFNARGEFQSWICYYLEDQLPQQVLFPIKQFYAYRHIFGVTEVRVENKTAYLVDLEDQTSWLKVKYLDGEITELNLLLK